MTTSTQPCRTARAGRWIVAATIAIAVCGMGIAPPAAWAKTPIVKIDGSSTVYPITEAVAEEFQISKRGKVRVTVGISGTGGGFKKFCRGETDLSAASRPITHEEMKICKEAGIGFIELPVAFDGITVVVHPDNDWVDQMTVAELKTIWEPAAQRKITRWSQVRDGWPDRQMQLFGAGADSGTYDYFTKAIVGKEHASRGDFTASEDDNVLVQGVSRSRGGLGFFGYAYYSENRDKLKAVPIVPAAGGAAVLPNLETVANGAYSPLSRPVFVYVSTLGLEKAHVRDFVLFFLKEAPVLVAEVGYIALPAEGYAAGLANVMGRVVGSAYAGGSNVGLSVTDVLAREKQH